MTEVDGYIQWIDYTLGQNLTEHATKEEKIQIVTAFRKADVDMTQALEVQRLIATVINRQET